MTPTPYSPAVALGATAFPPVGDVVTDHEPTVVGHVFSPRKGAGACLWSVGRTTEAHGDVDILLMSDGTVRWQKHAGGTS